MAHNVEQVYEGQPGTVTGVLATVPAATKWFSLQVVVCNTTALPASISLGKNGTTAAELFISAASIPANTTETLDLGTGIVLDATDTIDGLQGTSAAITVHIGATVET